MFDMKLLASEGKLTVMIALLATACLILTACAPETVEAPEEEPVEEEDREPIIITDRQWQTHWINNAIVRFIIENGYGYPTETKTLSTPAFQAAMEQGDVHLDTELWRVNVMEWYEEVTEEGTLIDLGPTFDRSVQAWYVPRYVIEGDEERGIEPMAPDLETVFDLADYWHVFEDPEDPDKGRFINGISGWEVTEINNIKLQVYGLDEYFNVQEPGSGGALDGAIAGAYERGEPVLAYYWEPTWLLGKYDMVRLQEPQYDEEVDERIKMVVDGELEVEDLDQACAYKEVAIHKGVHHSLKERAPEVIEFLSQMNVGTEPLNEISAYMEVEEVEAEEAALWFFENYEDRWRGWLPDEVEQQVQEALLQEGVDLTR